MKKTTRAALIRKLDKEFSIKIRSLGYCMAAGLDHIRCGGVLQCCHIVGRSNVHLRWDNQNALAMCQGHHVYYTFHPEAWRDFIQVNFHPIWKYLERERKKLVKVSTVELREMVGVSS